MRRIVTGGLAVLMALPLLAGCSGDPKVDEAELQAKVERIVGHKVADWPALVDVIQGACDDNDDALAAFGAMSMDKDGQAGVDSTVVMLEAYCPDRVGDFTAGAHAGM